MFDCHLIDPSVEYVPEYLLPVGCAGREELDELPLGDHDDLPPLLQIHPEKILDLLRDVLGFGHPATVREHQQSIPGSLGIALSSLLLAHIRRGPAYFVGLAQMLECQIDVGFRVIIGEIAAQGAHFPVLAAGIPVESERYAVEDHGLPGACAP
ncbi:hypothetical protein SDC9_83676 [bioreactor metagenome]|uniref:Uncharacterized protein n=1 Tax=bioreactor metagenome TaxID=1076179 RepID=A0A644Z860_9ZZZZ